MGKQNLSASLLTTFNDYYQRTIQKHLNDSPLLESMLGYHLGWLDAEGHPAKINPGKQIRPLLTLLSCGAMGGQPEDALAMAAGIELIHNFSLIHDDVMDNSDLRRGRPTVWKQWGVNQAINAGDGAYGISFQMVAETDVPNLDPQTIVYAERILAKACVDTVKGQMLDISFESRDDVQADEYRLMVELKTGPLLGAALAGGAIFAGAPISQADTLVAIGRHLGIAFQIQDDVLGIWGKPEETGKSASDDLTAKKKSLPILWAYEHLAADVVVELRELYQHPAPLPTDITARLYDILTADGVQEAIQAEAQSHYTEVVQGLETQYPTPSDYRDELFNIVAFIVNRAY
ncbi:MAG: polyprenyl synthetase family protein [Chloroflexi bacterium]|nr:polyprenyl synthetase family protein [Chloroflexota bacterium]